MTRRSLVVIPTANIAQRVQALQAEAKELAKEHANQLASALLHAETLAAEIAQGGDAYPAGVRDLARCIVEDEGGRIQNLCALIGRLM